MASPLMAFPLLSNLGTGGTGELVIGDVDPAHYTGEFRYLPVLNMVPGRMGYREIKMDAWNIGGIAIGYTDKTVMESGTSLFAVPSDAIKVLAKAVGAMEVLPIPPFNKEYLIDCYTPGPNLDFVLGGKIHIPTKADDVDHSGQHK